MDTTYDVRVYKTEVYRGKACVQLRVRWKTGGRDWRAIIPQQRHRPTCSALNCSPAPGRAKRSA